MPRLARVAAAAALAVAAISCGSQTAPSCTYSVTPAAVAFPPGGGSGTVNVATSERCSWTVVPNVTWLAVLTTFPPGRTGTGTAQFIAGPNPGSPRTGTVTVAGQTITVSQDIQARFTVSGTVSESWTAATLPGATVSIVSGPVPGTTTTDAKGFYALRDLPAGIYRLAFAKPPFDTRLDDVVVSGDTTRAENITVFVPFPATALNLSGHWAGGGPYPNNPFRLTVSQHGTAIEGIYIDARDFSAAVTGTYAPPNLALKLPVSGGELTIEAIVDNERHMHGFIKNERLGGNFPIEITR